MNRLARIVVTATVALATLTGSSNPVAAEISPAATDGVWGFAGDVGSDFNNFDAPVWAIEQIGSRIYVGGRFTTTMSGSGGRTETRTALVAFDSFSGDLLTDFAPDIRGGGVYTIEATADGRLFVGGEFTSVEGNPIRRAWSSSIPVPGPSTPTGAAGWSVRGA